MRGYVLIDPPVTLYSPLSGLLAWVDDRRDKLENAPGNPQWEAALAYAERLDWKHHVEQDEQDLLG